MRAFEDVREESDWRAPRSQNGQGRGAWKSKVKWGMLDMYDNVKLAKDRLPIEEADRERHTYLERAKQLDSYAERVSTSGAASSSTPHVLSHADD